MPRRPHKRFVSDSRESAHAILRRIRSPTLQMMTEFSRRTRSMDATKDSSPQAKYIADDGVTMGRFLKYSSLRRARPTGNSLE